MKKMLLSLSLFTLAVFLPVAPASADTLTLTLSNPVQTGAPGSTLTFDASVFAPSSNGATVFLNADNYGVSGPNTMDDSGFLFTFPLSLDPGDSFTGTLFTVALPAGIAVGTYNGFFEILGGPDADSQNSLASVDFQISAVPEPGTWVLLATGLGVFAMWTFGRRHLSHASASSMC